MMTKPLVIVLVCSYLGLGVSLAQPSIEAGPVTKVTVVRGAGCPPGLVKPGGAGGCARAMTSSTDFVDVPGASAEIKVGTNSVLIARFASDAVCQATFVTNEKQQTGTCQVVILASIGPGGEFIEMDPDTGVFESFHESFRGIEPETTSPLFGGAAQAIERSSEQVPPGTYTVKVQYRLFPNHDINGVSFSDPATAQPGSMFVLTAWHLTVEAARI